MKPPPRWKFVAVAALLAGSPTISARAEGGFLGTRGLSSDINSNAFESTPQVRSLSALVQIVDQLQRQVAAKDLASIHSEDAVLSVCVKSIVQRLDVVAYAQRDAFRSDLTRFAKAVAELHKAGDCGQQARAEVELAKVIETWERVKQHFPEWTVAAALRNASRYTCPMHPDVVGAKTNFCPKCGMELSQLIRVWPPDCDLESIQPIVRASVTAERPLVPGKLCTAVLRLEKAAGDPVLMSDLIETHTKKIHLLIIDESLTDYHHEHPVSTKHPGEYTFGFTPRMPGPYRVWADLRVCPMGLQEYAVADIPAATPHKTRCDPAVNLHTVVDGIRYDLVLSGGCIRAGAPTSVRLSITTSDGKPCIQLEPIMGAFAHLVAFHEDYRTVLHMHPRGPAVSEPTARGGPDLEFQIYALKSGLYRLFAQVQIDGVTRFAPFGIRVLD